MEADEERHRHHAGRQPRRGDRKTEIAAENHAVDLGNDSSHAHADGVRRRDLIEGPVERLSGVVEGRQTQL